MLLRVLMGIIGCLLSVSWYHLLMLRKNQDTNEIIRFHKASSFQSARES